MTEVPPPDDLPRSPSGRVPRWVVDEAMGRPVETPGFRTYSPPELPRSRSRRRAGRARRWIAGVVLVSLLAGVAVAGLRLVPGPTAAPAATTAPRASNAPPPGLEESPTPLGTPPPTRRSDAYRFGRTLPSGAPVAWSPCRPIHYVVRPDNEPPGGRRALARAIAEVSQATGLRFVNDGVTDEAPSPGREPYQPARYGDRWAPVLIAWATTSEVPDFGVDVVGEAGPAAVTIGGGAPAYVSGAVYLDADALGQIAETRGQAVSKAVILHELGHLVGLAHVDDNQQLMFPRASTTATTYQAGDLAGLAELGRGPCRPDV